MTPDKFIDVVRLMGERMKEMETLLKQLAKEHSETYRTMFIGNGEPAMRAQVRRMKEKLEVVEALKREIEALKKQLESVENWTAEQQAAADKSGETRQHWIRRIGGRAVDILVGAFLLGVAVFFGMDQFLK